MQRNLCKMKFDKNNFFSLKKGYFSFLDVKGLNKKIINFSDLFYL